MLALPFSQSFVLAVCACPLLNARISLDSPEPPYSLISIHERCTHAASWVCAVLTLVLQFVRRVCHCQHGIERFLWPLAAHRACRHTAVSTPGILRSSCHYLFLLSYRVVFSPFLLPAQIALDELPFQLAELPEIAVVTLGIYEQACLMQA